MRVRVAAIVVVPVGRARDRLRGGKDQPARLDTFGADQAIRELAHRFGGAAKQNHLKAPTGVEVNMSGGHYTIEMVVLEVRETLVDPASVVVVNQGDDPHSFALVLSDRFLDQRRSHQAAHGLAAVRIPVLRSVGVEPPE
jgi:hypothetical protein